MAEFPSMPLFYRDYLMDTVHLTAEQSGVYLHLLMHCWAKGGELPDDDAVLAPMAKVSLRRWSAIRPKIEPFWMVENGVWTNKRVTKELRYVEEARGKRVDAGRKGGRPKSDRNKENQQLDESNAFPDGKQSEARHPTPPHSTPLCFGGGGTRATPDEVLSLIGVDLSKSRNPTAWFDGAVNARLDAWRALGLDDGEIRLILGRVAAAKQGGPPSTIAYFDPAMQRAAGEKQRPTLTPIDGGRHEQRTDNADRLQRIIRAAAEGSSRQDWG